MSIEFNFNVDIVVGFDSVVGFVGMWEKEYAVEGASLEIGFGVQWRRDDIVRGEANVRSSSLSIMIEAESADGRGCRWRPDHGGRYCRLRPW